MPWSRYDDQLPFNRKVAMLRAMGVDGIAALGLHVLANTWSRGQGMQGFIPDYQPEQLSGRCGPKLARLLEKVGMFDPVDDGGGWMIHDYDMFSPPDDPDEGLSVEERRARLSKVRQEAGRLGGLAKARNARKTASKPASKPLANPDFATSKPPSKRVANAWQSSSPDPEPPY